MQRSREHILFDCKRNDVRSDPRRQYIAQCNTDGLKRCGNEQSADMSLILLPYLR